MSVTDMSKRVRGLMEWVGREQGGEDERTARRIALGVSASLNSMMGSPPTSTGEAKMEVDGEPTAVSGSNSDIFDSEKCGKQMMEKMMEELILFQERYGGAAGIGS